MATKKKKIDFKIPTLEQMKKDRYDKVLRYSIQGFLNNIHGAICAKMEFVDIPFIVYGEEDRKILDTMIEEFKKKKYDIQKMADLPQQLPTPNGVVSVTNVVHRVQIGESKMKFILKMQKDEKEPQLV